jgi:hypothetical protein
MGISDRKRSIDVSVNINLDFNEEIRPNNFIVENNFKGGSFVGRKKSGNILAGSKLNVDGQGIFNVKVIPPNLTKNLKPSLIVSEGAPPIPVVVLDCDITYNIIYYTPKQFQDGDYFEFMDGIPYYFEN